MILVIILMIHWSESAQSKCRDKKPDGLRCFPTTEICEHLKKKGDCKQKWINLKPDKKCSYTVKDTLRWKSVEQYCKKSCKVCGKHDLQHHSDIQFLFVINS